MPDVVRDRCPQDFRCPLLNVCPVEAIFQEGFAAPVIDLEKCIECGICIDSCPYRVLIENVEDVSANKCQTCTG